MQKLFLRGRWIIRGTLLLGALIVLCSAAWKRKYFLDENSTTTQGDLHNLSFLNISDEQIHIFPKKIQQTSREEADVITFGDSFFESTLDSYQFADVLAHKSNYTTHHVPVDDLMREVNFHPLLYAQAVQYTGNTKKIVLVESVERYALDIATYYYKDTYTPPISDKETGQDIKGIEEVKESIVNKDRINYFFNHNKLVSQRNSVKAQTLYRHLGEVSEKIGAIDPIHGFMFHYEQFDFLAREKEEQYLKNMADNIAFVQQQLEQKYDIHMFYLIMPNKVSIYPELAGVIYDDFIPRFEKILLDRGVRVISVYDELAKEKKKETKPSLYFTTDTHYTAPTKHLLVEHVIRQIDNYLANK